MPETICVLQHAIIQGEPSLIMMSDERERWLMVWALADKRQDTVKPNAHLSPAGF